MLRDRLIEVLAIGSVVFVLAFSGLVCRTAQIVEAFGAHFGFVQLGGLSPWAFIAGSPVVFAVGLGALWLLLGYLRFAARQLMRADFGRALAPAG